jgi:hypothetical protein
LLRAKLPGSKRPRCGAAAQSARNAGLLRHGVPVASSLSRRLVCRPDAILPDELLKKLIPGPMDAAGVEAVFQKLKRAVIERALGAELGGCQDFCVRGLP